MAPLRRSRPAPASAAAAAATPMRVLLVDLFCGTKSVSSMAQRLARKGTQLHGVAHLKTLTVDNDPSTAPDVLCDVGGDTSELEARLGRYIDEGYMVVFHMSPPCQEFSQMKTRGKRDLAGGLRLVHAALDLADRYACAWSLENPSTGKLWQAGVMPARLASFHRVQVDYCAYGHLTPKPTMLAFSVPPPASFVALRCRGLGSCPACLTSSDTGRVVHTLNLHDQPYTERIALPQQLCSQIVMALLQMARDARTEPVPAVGYVERDDVVVVRVDPGLAAEGVRSVVPGVSVMVFIVAGKVGPSQVIHDMVTGEPVGLHVDLRRCVFDQGKGRWVAGEEVSRGRQLLMRSVVWVATLSKEDGDTEGEFALDGEELRRRARNAVPGYC